MERYNYTALTVTNDGVVVCPWCGAPLRLHDTLGHEINNQTYLQPNDYEIDAYLYVCDECGGEFYSKEEL